MTPDCEMNTVVVTGATSMIGIALIEECLSRDVRAVYAIVRPGSDSLGRLPLDERIVIVECELEGYRNLPFLIRESCDTFYHLAWSAAGSGRDSDALGQVGNISCTLHALHAAHELGCRKFIGSGSQAEYGLHRQEVLSPHSPACPEQPYGLTKYAAGKLAICEARRLGMECAWVRVFSVFGAHDRSDTMISCAIAALSAGKRTSFTPAEHRWDYLYSADAGRAFYQVGKHLEGQKIYCLGSGDARPLREYIEVVRDEVDPSATLGIGDIPYPDGVPLGLCADISDLVRDVGWLPEVSFHSGIRLIIGSKHP